MPPVINRELCEGCGVCADICPMGVFSGTDENGLPVAKYEEECWHCNACVIDCPVNAMDLRIPLPAMILHMEAPQKGMGQK